MYLLEDTNSSGVKGCVCPIEVFITEVLNEILFYDRLGRCKRRSLILTILLVECFNHGAAPPHRIYRQCSMAYMTIELYVIEEDVVSVVVID